MYLVYVYRSSDGPFERVFGSEWIVDKFSCLIECRTAPGLLGGRLVLITLVVRMKLTSLSSTLG